MKVNCPTCGTSVLWVAESEFRPFCSKRCQMIDLGEWADEQHAIPTKPTVDPADMSDEQLAELVNALNQPTQPH